MTTYTTRLNLILILGIKQDKLFRNLEQKLFLNSKYFILFWRLVLVSSNTGTSE